MTARDGKVLIKLFLRAEVTPASLQAHAKQLLSRMHIESLVHGNMLKHEALSLAQDVEDTFKPEPLTEEELKSRQALITPEGAFAPLHITRSFELTIQCRGQ